MEANGKYQCLIEGKNEGISRIVIQKIMLTSGGESIEWMGTVAPVEWDGGKFLNLDPAFLDSLSWQDCYAIHLSLSHLEGLLGGTPAKAFLESFSKRWQPTMMVEQSYTDGNGEGA